MKARRMLTIVTIAGCLNLAPTASYAGSLVWGATEWTQIANWVELFQQTLDQYEQLQRIKAQLEEMYRQGETLTDMEWGNARENLLQLAEIVRDGSALAYSMEAIDVEYHKRFKDYAGYTQQAKSLDHRTFQQRWQEWSKENDDTIRGALKAANLQHEQFADEELTIATLEEHSQTAIGRMQAIQVGNEIATQQVRQLQKMRQLAMAQMQMQANFMAQTREKEEMRDAAREEFYKSGDATIIGDEKNWSHW